MTKGHERPEKKSPDSQSRAALMIEKDRKPAASQKAPRPKTAIPNGDYKTHKKLFLGKRLLRNDLDPSFLDFSVPLVVTKVVRK